jgi:hypothetical protein
MLTWENAGDFHQPCEELSGGNSPQFNKMKTTAVQGDSLVCPDRTVARLLKDTLQMQTNGEWGPLLSQRLLTSLAHLGL